MDKARNCFPTCNKFRCGKATLLYRRDESWCRWTEEPCEVRNCSYAICATRRLLPGGVCGETLKRKTSERSIEDIGPAIKVKGKIFRKMGEKELF